MFYLSDFHPHHREFGSDQTFAWDSNNSHHESKAASLDLSDLLQLSGQLSVKYNRVTVIPPITEQQGRLITIPKGASACTLRYKCTLICLLYYPCLPHIQ